MINLSPEVIALIMLGGLILGVLTGYPLAFVIGGISLIIGVIVIGPGVGSLLYDACAQSCHDGRYLCSLLRAAHHPYLGQANLQGARIF